MNNIINKCFICEREFNFDTNCIECCEFKYFSIFKKDIDYIAYINYVLVWDKYPVLYMYEAINEKSVLHRRPGTKIEKIPTYFNLSSEKDILISLKKFVENKIFE